METLELNHLRYFYEVARAGSFTEAARKLHISQSALSKAVSLLEQSEGVKLFERSKRGVTLTAVGAEVFQKSAGIFQTVREIQNACRGTKEVCEGHLYFGASDHVTNYLLIDKLGELRAAYPNLVTSTFTGAPNAIVAALLNHEIEFGLFVTPVNEPKIVYEPVATVEMAIVCRADLLPKSKGPLTLPQLREVVREHGFISSIRADYQSHPSQSLMNLLGKNPNISFESNSQETQKRLCLAGGGVAFLTRFMVEEELEKGKLVEILPEKPLTLQLHLAKRRSHPLSYNARVFLTELRKVFAEK